MRMNTLQSPVSPISATIVSAPISIRIWNKILPIRPAEPRRIVHPWIDATKTNSHRIYFRCAMIAYMLRTIDPGNNFNNELRSLFTGFSNIDKSAMGFPPDWEDEPLWK